MNDQELLKELALRLLCQEDQMKNTTGTTYGGFRVGEHVLICTDKRGVFAGRLESFDPDKGVVIATGIRMCLRFWDGRGVLGLTDRGPSMDTHKHRISATSPRGRLSGVTYISSLTPEASKAWDNAPTYGDTL